MNTNNKPNHQRRNIDYNDLKVGEDYYMDGHFLVFTEACHLKRGSCCESNCRHCPYGFREKLKERSKRKPQKIDE